MVPRGGSTPLGGAQSVPTSLFRSNSSLLGGQGGSLPSQGGFSPLGSPRTQFGNMNMFGNAPNVASILHQSFGNGGPTSGLSGPGSTQRGLIDNGAEPDPLSGVGNGMGYNASPSSSFVSVATPTNSNMASQVQVQQFPHTAGDQVMTDQQPQQLNPINFQHNQQLPQYSTPDSSQSQQQQQFQPMRSAQGSIAPVKVEPEVINDQTPQQLRNLATVKLEQQQLQNMRSITAVKMEPQHSDPSLFIQQQEQQHPQQQLLQMSRQSPQAAAMAQLLHQQRLMQFQQQQQQQLMKSMPQQRTPQQPQFHAQNPAGRSPTKPYYEPGMCARRLTNYMYQQQHRPEDNSMDFWRKFVAEYFAPNAKKKWCVSMYGSGRQTTGVFPQDVWHCEICNRKPGRGFEATVEVLPRLFKIKYESGTLEELLYVDMPCEYQNSSGQIVLDYAKAIQESVFEQLRVVRDGQLRIVFSPDLKIVSWEFCARRHEELIPRRLLIPQVSHLGAAAQKYQTATTQNASSNISVPDLQNNCNMFVASARQFAKALEVPLVNDLGYTKRYVRCLQISEVVNSMKDLIDYSREMGTGPMESLSKFPRRTNFSPATHNQSQQHNEEDQQPQQQNMGQNTSNHDDTFVQATQVQHASGNLNGPLSSVPTTTSSSNVAGRLLNQNSSMNPRGKNQPPTLNGSGGGGGVTTSPYTGSAALQMPSPSNSNPSPFQPLNHPPSSSNNNPPPQTSHNLLPSPGSHINSASSPGDIMVGANESQSSVQKIINEMLMSSQLAGGDTKTMNRVLGTNSNPVLNGSNCLVGMNGNAAGVGFRNIGNGINSHGGFRSGSVNNGRVGMGASMGRDQNTNQHQQQDFPGSQLLNGLGSVNGFNSLQFDWKSSP
ncbi:unnamed protein product [Cuscuta campestris]|uniref:Transcriptional corepressor SEUSS n=1 Tax=Cuscuta campestris TaxID=132261 RepID=A0A484MSR6_9ASTE|nr:unnamed protein product [Cuscuta campestris]